MKRGPQSGSGFGVSLTSATEAWGGDMPDWVHMLAQMADRSSQSAVGKAIGYSPSVVNAVLKRIYNGDMAAVEQAARGRFMAMTVMCPVLGDLAAHKCLDHQKKAVKFSGSSSLRVSLARWCRSGDCPHSRTPRRLP